MRISDTTSGLIDAAFAARSTADARAKDATDADAAVAAAQEAAANAHKVSDQAGTDATDARKRAVASLDADLGGGPIAPFGTANSTAIKTASPLRPGTPQAAGVGRR